MNFIHNRITYPTGNAPTLDDIVDKLLQKSAKTEQADDLNDTEDMQNVNNDNEEGAHSYQEGESEGKGNKPPVETMKDEDLEAKETTNEKKEEKEAQSEDQTKEAHCDREMGESDDAGEMVDDPKNHAEQGNAEVGEGETTQQVNAEPNYNRGESTDQSKAKPSTKKGPGDSVVGKSSASKSEFKKIAAMKRHDRLKTFAILAANRHNPREYVEAMVGLKWANLTDKEKEFLRKFWRTMYPDTYVEEMVADY